MFCLNLAAIISNPSLFIVEVFLSSVIKTATSFSDAGHPIFPPFSKLSPNTFPALFNITKNGNPAVSPLSDVRYSAAPGVSSFLFSAVSCTVK